MRVPFFAGFAKSHDFRYTILHSLTVAEWRGTLKTQKLEIEQLQRPALIKELAASHGGRSILSVPAATRTGLSVRLANSAIKAPRRLTYGTQRETGRRFVETVQTILETCRQQGRDPIAFIEGAITRARQE